MAGGGKHKIEYVEQNVPKFLQQFKARVNYKEGPTVDTKRQKLDLPDSDDDVEREDEKPTICVINPGDLTEEEYEQAKSISKQETSDKPEEVVETAKFVFKKPSEGKQNDDGKKKKEKMKSKSRKVKDTKLLSFGDDEDNGVEDN